MTAWLSPCRVSHKAASVGRVPGQAGPALGVEGTAWSDRGWAAEARVRSWALGCSPAYGPFCGWELPPRPGCLEDVLF